ncbi:MAG: hypothetical protein AB7G48_14575 [Nitrospiraceae bacterium]
MSRIFDSTQTLSVLALVLFLPQGPVFAAEAGGDRYESSHALPVGQVLEPNLVKGPYYQVEDPVWHDGYTNVYQVTSPFGSFLVRGDAMFARLRRELSTIADLRERTAAGMTAEAAVKELVDPVRAIGRLVHEPGKTLTGIPLGISRLMDSTQAGLSHEPGPYEDDDFESLMRMAAYKRRIAAHYHVDAYSSNSILQHELERAAWSHLAGYATTFALILVPAPNPLPLMMTSLTTVEALNRALEEQGPADLQALNQQKLKTMEISDDLAAKFLTHPMYSPRHRTVMVFSLEGLASAAHRERVLQAALHALSEEEALLYQQAAELLLAYHQREAPIVDLDIVGRLPIAFTSARTLFCPLALDYGIWTQKSELAFQRLATKAGRSGEDYRIEVWFTGVLSQKARSELLRLGIAPRENVARDIPLIDRTY